MPNNTILLKNKYRAKKIKIGTVKVEGKDNKISLQSKIGRKIKINTTKVALKNSNARIKLKGGKFKLKARRDEQV